MGAWVLINDRWYEAALLAWKAVAEHALAQKLGKTRWYKHYTLRVALVERQRGFAIILPEILRGARGAAPPARGDARHGRRNKFTDAGDYPRFRHS